MDAAAATITVRRTARHDIGHREVFVALDGETIAILRHGETVVRQVPPGRHRLRAHNTLFWKTLEIELQPGEDARFVAVNRAGWGTYSVLAWIGAGPLYLSFEREPDVAAPS
jgi:antitoxin (DNA-binding transcriptional repressor) of toxin-antitoxin stability system